MSSTPSDSKNVTCPFCGDSSLVLPGNEYNFFAEHYYGHRLESLQKLEDKL